MVRPASQVSNAALSAAFPPHPPAARGSAKGGRAAFALCGCSLSVGNIGGGNYTVRAAGSIRAQKK